MKLDIITINEDRITRQIIVVANGERTDPFHFSNDAEIGGLYFWRKMSIFSRSGSELEEISKEQYELTLDSLAFS